jgi:cation:H+ antiporter
MIILNFILFIFFFLIVLKSSDYAIKFSNRISKILRIPEFIVSFFIVAIISVLPESTISIISALNGQSELGLGTLLGSNVSDLTLVFGLITFFSIKGIKVKSRIIKNDLFYLALLLAPLILGFDGYFSRLDGFVLLLGGLVFFMRIYVEKSKVKDKVKSKKKVENKDFVFLILSLIVLGISAYLTVKFGVYFANEINIPPIFIGLTIVSIGTCLPELIFSIKAVKKNHESLALGDILGTVITDATIILGIVILINPFSFNYLILAITGVSMFLAGLLVIYFMKTDKVLSKTEGIILILFYLFFLVVEYLVNGIYL